MIDPKDYKKYFTTQSPLSCLHAEFLLKGSLAKAGIVVLCKDGVFDTYIRKDLEHACRQEGLHLYSDQKNYDTFMAALQTYLKNARRSIIPRYLEKNTITKEEFIEDAAFVGQLWWYYGFMEFPYMDLAYVKGDQQTKKRLEEAGMTKFKAREIMNAYFFRDGIIDKLLRIDDAKYLFFDEILELFDGRVQDKKKADQRRICYGAAVIDESIVEFPFETAKKLCDEFRSFEEQVTIEGVAVQPGRIIGRAIIAPMHNDQKKIDEIDKRMRKGDILIAESTSPDIMMLCEKAAGIVAEQGGLLSHAAIIAREKNIPGIVRATNATKAFKDGDIVEVDGNRGLAKRLTPKELPSKASNPAMAHRPPR